MARAPQDGHETRPRRESWAGSAGAPVLRSAPRRVFRAAVLPGGLARVADEGEQCPVDLVGVGPDDRVRPARDDDGARVVQQRGKPAAGGLVGQDAILVALDDQDGDANRGQVPRKSSRQAVTQRRAAWAEVEMAA